MMAKLLNQSLKITRPSEPWVSEEHWLLLFSLISSLQLTWFVTPVACKSQLADLVSWPLVLT